MRGRLREIITTVRAVSLPHVQQQRQPGEGGFGVPETTLEDAAHQPDEESPHHAGRSQTESNFHPKYR